MATRTKKRTRKKPGVKAPGVPAPTFKFRDGSRVAGVTAAAAAVELGKLWEQDGELRPDAVVESAADPDSPLHDAFDWDDSSAGHKYRLGQARTLIRSVVVTYPDMTPRSVYVHVRTEESVGYQPMDVVVCNEDMFASAAAELSRKLDGARSSLKELRELAESEGNTKRVAGVRAVAGHLDAAVQASKAVA